MKHKTCWSYVNRPNAVKNLPSCTKVAVNDQWGSFQIIPDFDALKWEIDEGFVVNIDDVSENYRGLCVSVSDHGNVSLLMRFKNGNTREVWGMV